jgi:hypothetical protein
MPMNMPMMAGMMPMNMMGGMMPMNMMGGMMPMAADPPQKIGAIVFVADAKLNTRSRRLTPLANCAPHDEAANTGNRPLFQRNAAEVRQHFGSCKDLA